MPAQTIRAAYVNEPRAPKGPGSVKDTEGNYWKAFPDLLHKFVPNGTYEVEYAEEEYQGKVSRRVTGVKELDAPQSSLNGRKAPAAHGKGPAESCQIWCQGIVQHMIEAKLLPCTAESVDDATAKLKAIWKRHFGNWE